jgi:hypothetical protein
MEFSLRAPCRHVCGEHQLMNVIRDQAYCCLRLRNSFDPSGREDSELAVSATEGNLYKLLSYKALRH